MKTEQLPVRARHYKYTKFESQCNFALSKAAKEHFNTDNVSEQLDRIKVWDKYYSHEVYDKQDFLTDKAKARSLNYSDEIIRTVTLIPK